jgi:proteasome accessory factor B
VAAAKLERLLNLTALLLAARLPVTADEIQRQLDYPEDQATFRRAFERDKEELRSMGIPLRVEPVPGRMPAVDGYRIPREEYALHDPGLTTDELAALHLAATAVQVEGLSPTAGLLKLGGLVGGPEPTAGVAVAPLPADPNLSVLFAAVASRSPVALRYRERDRRIDPYRLEFQRGRWYLTGLDHSHGEERNFRLDRVEGAVTVLDEPPFERPAGASTAGGGRGAWLLGGEEEVVARVRIDAEQARWAVQHVGPDHVVADEADGGVVIELPVTNRDAFRSFVLGFLDHAEVLAPPELRDEVVGWLAALAEQAPA